MRKRTSQFCGVLLLLVFLRWKANACHSKHHRRGKRQVTSSSEDDVGKTLDLRSYFSNCLKEKAGDIWDWESVIDVTVLDSKWYQNTDTGNCSDQDTSDCWKSRLQQFLSGSSPLAPSSEACIDEYQRFFFFQGQRSIVRSQSPRTGRSKRQVSSSDRCTDFYPNSPKVREYGRCGARETRLQPGRREIDYASVSEFVAENTICGDEFEGCGSNGEEVISQNDPSVPKWPFRFEALVRKDSPVYNSILICNELVFPLLFSSGRDAESRCTEWQAWSRCSKYCGPGFQKRTRNCPKSFSGQTHQKKRCQSKSCRRNPILDLIIRYILISKILKRREPEITCRALNPPAQGFVMCKPICSSNQCSIQTKCTYGCNGGHTVSDVVTRTCQSDGSWSYVISIPSCLGYSSQFSSINYPVFFGQTDQEITCSALNQPADMITCTPRCSNSQCSIDTSCVYRLTVGNNSGLVTQTCQSNGTWSNAVSMLFG